MTFATFQSNRNKTGRIAMLVGCLLAGSLGVAQAATPSEDVPTVVVSYADLDVSTPDGRTRALPENLGRRSQGLPVRGCGPALECCNEQSLSHRGHRACGELGQQHPTRRRTDRTREARVSVVEPARPGESRRAGGQ